MSGLKQQMRVMDAVIAGGDYTPPEDLYADMRKHTSPRIRAIAAAEWDAMDAQGRLPADWTERRAELEARLAANGGVS